MRPLVLGFVLSASLLAQESDPVLHAMKDEMRRSLTLQLPNLEKPYYVDYSVDESHVISVLASLGGIISAQENFARLPRVRIRVGDYAFDNTDFVGTNFGFLPQLPRENDYNVLRRLLWLDSDRVYKSAVEAISRKRAALKSLNQSEELPDFEKRPPTSLLTPAAPSAVSLEEWRERVRRLSAVFDRYPGVKTSSVAFTFGDGTHRFVNSEGSEIRTPERVWQLRANAVAQAADGMTVRNWVSFQSLDPARLPSEAELQQGMDAVAKEVTAIAAAPMGEDYTGPVVFEGAASAQIFAEVLGRNLSLSRKPVGQSGKIPASELEGRQGVRVLPEMFDVIDDPARPNLFGSYLADEEGVAPQKLQIIEKGVLRTFLTTREPKRGFAHSNGHARLPGAAGSNTASISNLIVQSRETMAAAALKDELLQLCRQRGKPYGIVIRKMDFPSSAGVDEARRILSSEQAGLHPVSQPILVSRVYLDGHEELVRGLRLRAFNAKSLKDILFTGDDRNVFEFEDNGQPFALTTLGGVTAESCVVAPSILIDDVDLFKIEEDQPKLPIVPPPSPAS